MFIEGIILGASVGIVVTLILFNLYSNQLIKRESASAYRKGVAVGTGIKEIADKMKKETNV